MKILFPILTVFCAYFLGGINGSIIASRVFFHRDVRDYGSHNAGLTNFYRNFGLTGLLLVVAADVLKSVVAILIGAGLMGLLGHAMLGRLLAGLFLMLGHFYPAFYQFKGGKGVLCAGVLALMVDWRVGLVCWGAFIVLLLTTRLVSLGSVVGVTLFPSGLAVTGMRGLELVLAILCAACCIFKHYPNIRRLLRGEESRLSFRSRPPAE